MVQDRPGTVARISTILSSKGISITSLLQKEESRDNIPLVMTTHEAREGAVLQAMKEIEGLEETVGSPTFIRIIEEHPESVL